MHPFIDPIPALGQWSGMRLRSAGPISRCRRAVNRIRLVARRTPLLGYPWRLQGSMAAKPGCYAARIWQQRGGAISHVGTAWMNGAAQARSSIVQAPPNRRPGESIASVCLSHASWGGIWSVRALQEGADRNYICHDRQPPLARSNPSTGRREKRRGGAFRMTCEASDCCGYDLPC